MHECFELMKQRGTLSPALLGFESGTVTREQVHGELRALASQPQPGEVREAWVPSERRYRTKAALRDQWYQPGLARLRDRARAGFEEFRTAAGTPAGTLH